MGWNSGLQLRVLEGQESGRTVPLEGKRIKVGRRMKPNIPAPRDTIWIDDPTISRVHSELRWNEWAKVYALHHRSETNLTRVNGESIGKHVLEIGDRIGMGSAVLEIQRTASFPENPNPRLPPVPAHLKCPRDKTNLTPSSLRDVPFAGCSYCNGAWLEEGCLSRIHGHPEDIGGAVEVEVNGGPSCPRCDVPMGKVYLPGSGGLEIVRCRNCHGVWLDTDGMKDTLQAIRKVHGAAPSMAAPLPPIVTKVDAPTAPPEPRRVTMEAPASTSPEQRNVLLDKLRKNRTNVPAIPAAPVAKEEKPLSLNLSLEDIGKVSIIAIVDALLAEAVRAGVSDIHLEGVRDQVRIRYRVDGQLTVSHIWPKDFQALVVTRLQVMAELDIAKPWLPQDGHFVSEVDGKEHDFRLATIPTERGPACVVRILAVDRGVSELHDLGLHPDDLKLVRLALGQSQGFILSTGPSGSGKTTSLYAMISALCARPIKTVTIEDPVEYRLDQVMQVSVNHRVGLDFAKGLRSALRLDPDAILVGEIRDKETAEIAVQASLTGHLLLSTLHTRGTVESIFRLIEMGVEPYLVKEVINCVIAQRLVRVLCVHCKEEYTPPASEMFDFAPDATTLREMRFYRPRGCDHCNHLGYKGRTGIMEVLLNSEAVRDAITSQASAKEIRSIAIQAGMRPLQLNAFEKVCQGITSFEEVRQVVGAI